MAKAFKEEYPEAKLTVNYQLSNSMYCVIDNMEITEEFFVSLNWVNSFGFSLLGYLIKNPSLYFTKSNTLTVPVEIGEMINKVKSKMKEIIEKDLEITKVVMSREEARKFYEKEKNKTGILLQLNKKDELTLLLQIHVIILFFEFSISFFNASFILVFGSTLKVLSLYVIFMFSFLPHFNSKNKIITCICNNKVKSLNHKIHEDCNIELLDYTNKEGKTLL